VESAGEASGRSVGYSSPVGCHLDIDSISLYRVMSTLTVDLGQVCFRSFSSQSRVIQKLCRRICAVVYYSCLCFVLVNQLHLFAVNINKYHWLIQQPITVDFQYVRRPLLYGLSHDREGSIRTLPLPTRERFARSHYIAGSQTHDTTWPIY